MLPLHKQTTDYRGDLNHSRSISDSPTIALTVMSKACCCSGIHNHPTVLEDNWISFFTFLFCCVFYNLNEGWLCVIHRSLQSLHSEGYMFHKLRQCHLYVCLWTLWSAGLGSHVLWLADRIQAYFEILGKVARKHWLVNLIIYICCRLKGIVNMLIIVKPIDLNWFRLLLSLSSSLFLFLFLSVCFSLSPPPFVSLCVS